MPQEVLNIIWAALGTIVTGLVGWGVTMLIAWLNTKIKDEKLRRWATAITAIIGNSVQSVSQSFVDTLKKQGKFDAVAQAEAKEKALAIINNQLTPELKDYITSNFGDMTAWLNEQIESKLYELKNK